MMIIFNRYQSLICFIVLSGLFSVLAVSAADDISLKPGISFDQDLDTGFPIICQNQNDIAIEQGHPTLIFFGASGDLNTNKQAKRLVDLYRRYKSSSLKFIVVDVDSAVTSPAMKQLIKSFYGGYIPDQILLDKTGKQAWHRSGEVEVKEMQHQIDQVL